MNLADHGRLQGGFRVRHGWIESVRWIPLVVALVTGSEAFANSDAAGDASVVTPPAPPSALSRAEVSDSPQTFFESVKGLVFPLKTALGPGDPKRSYGTAFVVDPAGILATNFHVVSDVVSDPGKYNLYLEVPAEDGVGKTAHLGAEIIALDIIHDLALVKVERQFAGAFKLASEEDPIPSAAERVWSIGKPLDLSMALVEGNFNGEIRIGNYAKFFLSTPINQGMSGGPTVDTQGVVRGVNYAILTKKQNVSFAVPGRYLTQLIAAHRAGAFRNPEMTPPCPTQRKSLYRNWLGKQVSEAGALLVDDIIGRTGGAGVEKQQIRGGALSLAELPSRLKCWQDRFNRVGLGKRPEKLELEETSPGDGDGSTGDGLTMTLTSCDTGFTVDLGNGGNGRDVGDIRIGMLSIKAAHPVVTPRDWKLLGGRLGDASGNLVDAFLENRSGLLDSDSVASMRSCRRTPVKNSAGMGLDLGFCLSKQEKHPELHDAVIRIGGGLDSGEAFAIVVHARGFAVKDLQSLSAFLLEGLRLDGAEKYRSPAATSATETSVDKESGP